ncbi:pentapeptide repeat-containing protein [Streptomyces sp. CCM_MD2014]|uniref:pentapeptide repeat-containing protein n=1 Tax=Streptomyces sp. CCM_MD2014 TaxID=1561022 RepID=UPI001F18798E
MRTRAFTAVFANRSRQRSATNPSNAAKCACGSPLARLHGARLRGARLRGARLRGARLRGARVSGSRGGGGGRRLMRRCGPPRARASPGARPG